MSDILVKWVKRISAKDFPLFAHTARKIASITQDYAYSTNDLAEVILCDSALTARVLRMVNSAYYNPGRMQVNTVSRAIIMLGFDVVRNIALTSSMIESMLTGQRHDRAIEELAISYHAAVQAKRLASISKEQLNVEEIFIAALLHRLGHIAFWCFPSGKAKKLLEVYQQVTPASEAEYTVLGFTLNELTRALIVEWKVSSLLPDAMDTESREDISLLDIEFGYEIAKLASKGWQRESVKSVIHSIGKNLKIDTKSLEKFIRETAVLANQSMLDLGLNNRVNIVDTFEADKKELHPIKQTLRNREQESVTDLQFSVLRDLTYMLSCHASINTILSAILEGVYRALEMDHVVLAIINAKGDHIDARYVLGKNRVTLQKQFSFPINSNMKDMFNYTIKRQEPICLTPQDREKHPEYFVDSIDIVAGSASFLLAPIRIKGQIKGVIYAEKKSDEISEHIFSTFCHFCEHANIAFNSQYI